MDIQRIDVVNRSFFPTRRILTAEPCHIKALPYLSVVQAVEGSYRIKLDDSQELSTGEGGFFIAPAWVKQTITHCYSEKSGIMRARWLFLDVRINGKYTLDEIYDFPMTVTGESAERFGRYFDRLTECRDICTELSIIYGMIGDLIDIGASEKPRLSGAMYRTDQYIRANLTRHLTVKELAEVANMSEAGFYSAFRRQFSRSPIDYVNGLRLALASNLLETGEDSVTDIAAEVGIGDPFYFSRLFKKEFGLSPREYRKRLG